MGRHVSNGLLCHSCDSANLIIVHFHKICYPVLNVDIGLGARLGYFLNEILDSLPQLSNHLFMRRTELS